MPSETIRKRIENTKSNDWLNVGNPRLALMDILWRAGNLLPADEADARVAAAERKGMERALAAACSASKPAMGARYNGGVQQAVNAIRADMEADDG